MLGVTKDVAVVANLDLLKLIDATTTEVVSLTRGSFFSNGSLAEGSAIRNLHAIRGKMEVLQTLVASISK